MTSLRYLIYAGGSLLFSIFVAIFAIKFPALVEIPFVIVFLLTIGLIALIAFDGWLHCKLFGRRVRILLKKYTPCATCPVTGYEGTEPRLLIANVHGYGPVSMSMSVCLPILISKEAAIQFPRENVTKMPGIFVARVTHTFVVLYLKNENYYRAFIIANEKALI